MSSQRKNVKLDIAAYERLKKAANSKGLKLSDALRIAVDQFCGGLPEDQIIEIVLEERLSEISRKIDQLTSTETKIETVAKHKMKPGRLRGRNAKEDRRMDILETRRTSPDERLAFLALVYFSKPVGLSKEELLHRAQEIWELSQEYKCFSWGNISGDMHNALTGIAGIDRRQRSDFLDVRANDLIVATWGKMALGWGFATPKAGELDEPCYSFHDPKLKELWDIDEDEYDKYGYARDDNDNYYWFQHTIDVDWKKTWEFGEVELPSFIAPQPTFRRPHSENEKAWTVLRELGIPIDNHGVVTE
ncbi:MAG: hypothetical protein V3V10_04145 [Planctomycetota bacterium]